MKKLRILLTSVLAMALLFASWTKAQKIEAAIRISDAGCEILDGAGNSFIADRDQVVITSSGNENLICKAKGIPNSTGKAVHYNFENTGFLCLTDVNTTDQWHETLSPSGVANVQCKLHPKDE